MTREELVLDFVRIHGFITRKQCTEFLDLRDIEARTLLHRMRDKGVLRQIGYKKVSCYKKFKSSSKKVQKRNSQRRGIMSVNKDVEGADLLQTT